MNLYQGSFVTGEITPELYGRVDLQRYQSSPVTFTAAFRAAPGRFISET